MGGPLNNLYHWSLDKRVLNKLKGTGFDTLRGFNKNLCLNLPLINMLISRYDADTRSFILGSAENPFNVAFGLEDVLYITGLPIDGKPVTGVDPKDTKSVCQRYLGKHKGYGRDSDINLSWLKENFMTLDENLSEEELGYHVRAYALYVIGCTFSPGNNHMVRAMFLPLLENVDDIGSYAWGAAFLANIHDSMEKSTRYSVGLYFPLMIFAYIRFPGLSSTIEIERTAINAFPLAVSWSHALGLVMKQQFKNHHEEMLETFFDNLKEVEEEVKWQPYGELSRNFLPQHLREQVVLSKSRTILICFEKAVYHRPDKCQRQLGLEGYVLEGKLIEIETLGRAGRKGYDWSKKGKYKDYVSEWDKRFDLLIDRDVNASPDLAKASDHTYGNENVAPIVAEAGWANDEMVAVLDNQDPERDSRQFDEERELSRACEQNITDRQCSRRTDYHVYTRRTEASAELRKENGKSKEEINNRKNFPEHVNRISCIDNVDVDHQSSGDTTSSRVRNSTEVRSCHPQVEVPFLARVRKAAENTSACVTADESFSLNIENTVSNAAILPPQTPEGEVRQLSLIEEDVVTDIPVPRYKERVTVDTEVGLSTRKKRKTCSGGSDSPSSWEDLSCEEPAVKVWKKLKQVDSTNKELQQQIITLQSGNQALQVEKQKLEASHSQKDHALTQLQKNHLDEVSTLKGQLNQVDSTNKELQQHIITLQSVNQASQAEKQKLEASHSQKDHALKLLQKNHLDEVSTLKGQLKQVDSANKELQQQIITLQSANRASQAEKQKLEASHSQKDHALKQLQKNYLDEVSTLKGQLKQVDSTNKELQQQIKTLQSDNEALEAEKQKLESSHSQKDHALTQLQKNHFDEVSTLEGQVDLTNKELQQQIIAFQSANQALQVEKQKLEASHSQKDHALTQLQKYNIALNDEVFILKGQLKQKDETLDFHLEQGRAAHEAALQHAILKYKASAQFAEDFQIVKAPVLLHEYTLGVDDAKAPELDIGSLANSNLYKHGQGDETEKPFNELDDGQDILAMYKPRPPAHQSAAGDTTSSRVRNSTEIRSCHPQMEAINVKEQRVSPSTTTTPTAGGVVDQAEPPLIIDVKSESDSNIDSDESISDSFMDALVGTSKNS